MQAQIRHTYRSLSPAHSDPVVAQQTRLERSRTRIVRLRWTSPGLQVRPDNTHHYHVDGLSFALDDLKMQPAAIEEPLEPEFATLLVGSTDIERYFAPLHQEMRRCEGDTVGAVSRTVALLRARFPVASLNAMMPSASGELVVFHANSIEDTPRLQDLPTG